MSPTLLVILVTIAVVALFTLAISLTLIFKGHNIDSEIGENKNMRDRGIKCAAQQLREQEGYASGIAPGCSTDGCSPAGCSTCAEDQEHESK